MSSYWAVLAPLAGWFPIRSRQQLHGTSQVASLQLRYAHTNKAACFNKPEAGTCSGCALTPLQRDAKPEPPPGKRKLDLESRVSLANVLNPSFSVFHRGRQLQPDTSSVAWLLRSLTDREGKPGNKRSYFDLQLLLSISFVIDIFSSTTQRVAGAHDEELMWPKGKIVLLLAATLARAG